MAAMVAGHEVIWEMSDHMSTKPGRGHVVNTTVSRRKIGYGLLIGVFGVCISLELFARYFLGLGDPPLCMPDPNTAYIFKPNQSCHRFGHYIHYNSFSMRADDFSMHKSSPNEFRVMVIGDSVINGGVATDQSKVCTSLLKVMLQRELKRPVNVGNISAGGWGPLNEWNYEKTYGLFDADVLVIVLRSGDTGMSFRTNNIVGVNPDFPDHKPTFAATELFTRYLPRYIPGWKAHFNNEGYIAPVNDALVREACLNAIHNMINTAATNGVESFVLLHWSQSELAQAAKVHGWRPQGHIEIERTATTSRAKVLDLYSVEERVGAKAYRDDIHISASGQQLLSQAMMEVITNNVRINSIQTVDGV